MEKRVKLRVPRLIRSSINSCRPRDLYDVVETTSTFTTHTTSSLELTKPKTKTTPCHRCPPTSPSFPPNPFYDQSHSFRKTKAKTKKKKKKTSQFGSDSLFMSSSRFKSTGSWCWSSSEEEEEETFFSSRSLTSDSSTAAAVVKKSENPYEDFKKSMVEMIVERQIFRPEQLQQLLHCFISLNSRQHHNVIVHVFLDIYATLFSSPSM